MKKYLKLLSVLILISGLSSCLKDEPIIGGKPQNIVEFYTTEAIASPTSALYPVYVKSYLVADPSKLNIILSYSGTDVAPQDITLQVEVDQATLDKFNNKANVDENQTYDMLPTNAYILPTKTVVIKKGERRATLTVDINIPATFDFSKVYALPLTIKSASLGTISGNFGSVLYAIGAKNKYDGEYKVEGTLVDRTVTSITGKYPLNYYLVTQTSTSNALYDLGRDAFYHTILSAGSVSVYGDFAPVFTFDDAGNITKVVNYYGQPASNGRSAGLNPTGQNKFVSGTPGQNGSVFKVKYYMYQPGSNIRTEFDETYTYVGPTSL
jgi:hypothetical protein